MMKKLAFAFLVFLIFPIANFAADLSNTTVYYINNESMSYRAALKATEQARQKLFPTVSPSQMHLIYLNQNDSIKDMRSAILANISVDGQRTALEGMWVCKQNPLKCGIDYLRDPNVVFAAYKRAGDFDEQVIKSRPIYQLILGELYQNFGAGRKAFVISDSQGASYANAAISYIQTHPSQYLSDPFEGTCIGHAAIAPMTTYVASCSTNSSSIQLYATRPDDVVVQAIASTYHSVHPSGAQVLPPNLLSKTFGSDASGHKLSTYLNDNASYAIIADNIERDMAAVNSNCSICNGGTFTFGPFSQPQNPYYLDVDVPLGSSKRTVSFTVTGQPNGVNNGAAVYSHHTDGTDNVEIADLRIGDGPTSFVFDPVLYKGTSVFLRMFILNSNGGSVTAKLNCQ